MRRVERAASYLGVLIWRQPGGSPRVVQGAPSCTERLKELLATGLRTVLRTFGPSVEKSCEGCAKACGEPAGELVLHGSARACTLEPEGFPNCG